MNRMNERINPCLKHETGYLNHVWRTTEVVLFSIKIYVVVRVESKSSQSSRNCFCWSRKIFFSFEKNRKQSRLGFSTKDFHLDDTVYPPTAATSNVTQIKCPKQNLKHDIMFEATYDS